MPEITDEALPADQNQPLREPPYKDNDGNEITTFIKVLWTILLIFFTVFSTVYIVAHWPDKLVSPKEDIKPLYTYDWFNVRLAGIPDSCNVECCSAGSSGYDTIQLKLRLQNLDSLLSVNINSDSAYTDRLEALRDSVSIELNNKRGAISKSTGLTHCPPENDLIHINTLLMVLVAMGGFLGNLIYVATSFTTFLGNGQFRKSWTLFYFIKPFTAASLAVAIYFVFRGGFLNMSDDSTNINIYGLMTIAILSGLFTDRTTLKLKEVFDVLLRPKEERADPLKQLTPVVHKIITQALDLEKENIIVIEGENLNNSSIGVRIDNLELSSVVRKPDSLTITYRPAAVLSQKKEVLLQVTKDAKPIFQATLKLKQPGDAPDQMENS